MKEILKRILSSMGFKIVRIDNNLDAKIIDHRDPFEMKRYLTNKPNEKVTIFDIGAFDGSTALRYKKLFPLSKIYCFEPFPESFSKLVENTSACNNIIPIKKGFAEKEGISKFYCNIFSPTNSLLKTHKDGCKVWGDGLLDTMDAIEVELISIDSFVKDNRIQNIDILKMDVQGAEYKVINGAKETLEKGIVKLIYTEIITLPTYEDQLEFYEMIELLKSFGFKLFNLYNISLTDDGQMRQLDAIFIKST